MSLISNKGSSLKFIIFVIDGAGNTAGADEMKKIDAFNDQLRRDGNWVAAAGIAGPENATLIDNREGKNEIVRTSLFKGPEHYSGFWLIEAKTEEEARLLALNGSLACNRKVELRPFLR